MVIGGFFVKHICYEIDTSKILSDFVFVEAMGEGYGLP